MSHIERRFKFHAVEFAHGCYGFSVALLLGAILAHASVVLSAEADRHATARARMVEHLKDYARATGHGNEAIDPAVLTAMSQVPRHRFVPEAVRDHAYENRPLPIGHGQTISQPYIVALMTDLLNVGGDDVVLEVGTGSGYQAAVLAEIVKQVCSIEILEPLGKQAAGRLARLGYDNVTTRIGDGYHGWADHAPFDAIMVTAGAEAVPPPLVRQLKPGGRMIIPVDSSWFTQHLLVVAKTPAGAVETRQLLPVRFVPLTGDH